MRVSMTGSALIAALAATACKEAPTSPRALSVITSLAADRLTGDTPNYNLEVILRDVAGGDGFGHVKFRQPGNDDAQIVYLDVWVRDLAPNTDYVLQRAADAPNSVCTSTTWVSLGNQGNGVATPIVTDEKGTGRGAFFRTLGAPGGTNDIRFRVVRRDNPTVAVLMSECYQFTVK